MDPTIYFNRETSNLVGCVINGAIFGYFAVDFDGETNECYARADKS